MLLRQLLHHRLGQQQHHATASHRAGAPPPHAQQQPITTMKHINPAPLVTLTLTVSSHDDTEASKSFSRREGAAIVIGRSSRSGGETPASDNALFRNQVLSRSHATLTWQKDGSIFITDDKSTHGTIVQRSPRQIAVGPLPTRLLDGDQLILGKTVTRANENKTAVNYEPLILKVSIAPDRKANPRSALPAVPAAASRKYALQTQEQLFTDDEEDEQAEGGQDASDLNALNSDGGYKSQRKSSSGRQSSSPELKERLDQFMKNRKRSSQSPEQQYISCTQEALSKPAKRPTPIVISGSESGSDAARSPLPIPSSPEPAAAEQTHRTEDYLCMPTSPQLHGSDEGEEDEGENPSSDHEDDVGPANTNRSMKIPETDSEDEKDKVADNYNEDVEEGLHESSSPLSSAAIESEAVARCGFPLIAQEEDSDEEEVEMEEDENEYASEEEFDEEEVEEEDEEDEDDEVVSRRRMVIESDEGEDGDGSEDESDQEDDLKLQDRNDQDSEEDEVSEDSSQIFDPEPTPPPSAPYRSTRHRDQAPASSNTSTDDEPLLKKVRLDAVDSQESEISQSSEDIPGIERLLPTQLSQTETQPGFTRASDLLISEPTLSSTVNVLQAKKFKKPMRDAGVQAEVPSKVSMAVQTVIKYRDAVMEAENQGTESVLITKKRTHDVMLVTDDMEVVKGIGESLVNVPPNELELRPKKGLPWRAAARYTSVFALGALAAVVSLATIPELD